jgi:hypothetical protein
LLSAGAADPATGYEVDLFGPHAPGLYAGDRLQPLKASLLQIFDLSQLRESRYINSRFCRHVHQAGISDFNMSIDEAMDLHLRYAAEWQPLIANGKLQGLAWANWIRSVGKAA